MSVFIPPSEPVEQSLPPSGRGWVHEVKFDGYRIQIHKERDAVFILSKNGNDFTNRFPDIAKAALALGCKTCIVDAEGVAPDEEGRPDFRALVGGQRQKMAWCFDLMVLNGKDLRALPLVERRARLAEIVDYADSPLLRFSDGFADAAKLLSACCDQGLEGIVSKKSDQPYVSGKNRGWIKVKCHAWREANRGRGELFNKGKRA